ncbi:hypothetical protein M569_12422, partial [Genlisea aurea]
SRAVVSSSNSDPATGLVFDSHEAAYDYYKDYAKSVGFGTAKLSSRRSRSSKEFIDAKFSCIRYGNKQQSDDAINPRPSPKIGCKASMHVKRKACGKWYIHSFVKDHNHELLPDQVHFFRSHRSTDSSSPHDAKLRKKRALLPSGLNQFVSPCSIETVILNQNDRGRYLALEEGDDAQVVLEFCECMHLGNPNFFYALDFNEEHRLRNVLWVDAKGVEDFAYFDDVVSFDTTYFSTKYRVPLVIFVGVNHHLQPLLLGCGLIADETLHTYVWLMQSWCLAMGGKTPKVILTDQNEVIKTAIPLVFPGTRHFYHLCHVLEKISRRVDYSRVWHETLVKKLNKCLYRSWDEEQFKERWGKLIQRWNLQEDECIQSLYLDRKLWVPTFVRDVSFAGLSPASRSESLNSHFDKYIHGDTSLRDFLKNYRSIIADGYEEEAKANFDAWHETPELKSPSPFEKQVLFIYTAEIFRNFQTEVLGAAACHLKKEGEEDGSICCYSVKDLESDLDFIVKCGKQGSDLRCSCGSFQYKGYLCRHAIVVLQMTGVFNMPFKFILKRWTNLATSTTPMSERLEEVQAKVQRYNDLCRRAVILGEEGSLSVESYDAAHKAVNEALCHCVHTNGGDES